MTERDTGERREGFEYDPHFAEQYAIHGLATQLRAIDELARTLNTPFPNLLARYIRTIQDIPEFGLEAALQPFNEILENPNFQYTPVQ